MYITLIIGTRPNYMKAFPIYRELENKAIPVKMIHTGQHYDPNMNDLFFKQLNVDKPDVEFNMKGCSTEAEQMSVIIKNLNDEFLKERPTMVLVFGDVTSSLAGAIVANKLRIKLAHVESGLRSFDRDMPEEINRILIDNLSDYLFITEKSGTENLINDNIPGKRFFVGNTMIDTLVYVNNKGALNKKIFSNKPFIDLVDERYIVVTIHRQSNVGDLEKFEKIVNYLNKLSETYKLVFPIHHRTLASLDKLKPKGIKLSDNIIQTKALGYLEFMSLVKFSSLVLTDSGGIQEETAFLGIPCVTLRDNTERPVTLDVGSNVLCGVDEMIDKVEKKFDIQFDTDIPLWDGKAAKRIVNILVDNL